MTVKASLGTHAVGTALVLDDLFHEELGLPVRVGAAAGGVLLVDRQVLRVPVDRRR